MDDYGGDFRARTITAESGGVEKMKARASPAHLDARYLLGIFPRMHDQWPARELDNPAHVELDASKSLQSGWQGGEIAIGVIMPATRVVQGCIEV